jgi:PAS domain S-box-containing protein
MLGAVVNITEVTEQRAQRDMLRTQARILETMLEGVVLVDAATRVIRLTNPTFDRLFGYRPGELIGQSIEPLISLPGTQRKRFERGLRDPHRMGAAPVEFECVRQDNARFIASCVISPLSMGGTDHWLAVLNDVTERKRLERGIIEIANREQQRIGCDLHDGLGQELTGIALMLRGVVAQLSKEKSGARLDVEDVIGLVNNAIENTRTLARGLSPVSAERGGLIAALRALAARASERYGVHVEFRDGVKTPLHLNDTYATHLYRIAQEALTNVVRHSFASEVTIGLETLGDELQLRIDDNGRGFTPQPPDGVAGLGLKMMRYRAQMLGGDLVLETSANGGASVRCSCPLES